MLKGRSYNWLSLLKQIMMMMKTFGCIQKPTAAVDSIEQFEKHFNLKLSGYVKNI